MENFITLRCPSCGAKLQLTKEIDNFYCESCGNEHILKRNGGAITIKPVIEGLSQVKVGVDRTANELALQRIKGEIKEIEGLSKSLRKKAEDSMNIIPPFALMSLIGLGFFTLGEPVGFIIGIVFILFSIFLIYKAITRRNELLAEIKLVESKVQAKKKEIQTLKKNI